MIKIRRNVFETNSSSTHSISLCMKEDYEKWERGEAYLADWWPLKDTPYEGKTFISKEEAREIMLKKFNCSDPSNEDLANEEIYDMDHFFSDDLESFSETLTTPSGETVIAFGQFGYDG